ncbi:carboxy-terminal kinesin 2-like [Xenia sp. Carnegie-2017]|uniref:carboxy-terminal kinesin 2-like n=1 Tax=Xenia sp. Carnegie-2017 TaxID=2897299 RepID=UPI001F03ADCE|nr:carboxy-terminal kinesin 2-like [Xenia sp. Carnegie-2017]
MENDRQASVILQFESKLREHQDSICELEARLRGKETIRRQLRNKIQELKGNIRVYCRVRPSLPSETSVSLTNMEFANDTDIILRNNSKSSTLSKKSQQARMSFSFDKAFCPETTQVTIYQETAQLVQSVLDGYNVCIFAYGQTGSGKTFTMESDIKGRDTWGVIPRAKEQVFFSAKDLMSKGWKYEIQASFLEIYSETIRDLLGNPDSKHEIKQVTTNNGKQANDVFVTNLKAVAVTSSDQASHVPYRTSKLTHLLQNSLGGNSKSLMFVNVSPREDSFQETLCSLRFATQV